MLGEGDERRYPTDRREWLVAFGHEIMRIPVWAGSLAILVGMGLAVACGRR